MKKHNPHPVARLAALSVLWIVMLQIPLVIAAPSEKDSQEVQWSEKVVRQRANETEAAIAKARQSLSADNASALGVELNALETRVRLWVELESAYEGLLTEIQKKAELETESGAQTRDFQSGRRKAIPEPPYPLSYLDELLVETETLRQNIEISEMALNSTQRSVAESRMQLNNAQDRLDRFRRESDPQQTPVHRWEMEGLELRAQLAEALRRLYLRRTENIQRQKQQAFIRAEQLGGLVKRVQGGLAYDEADLNRQLGALSQKKEEIEKTLDALQKIKKQSNQQLLNAQILEQKTVSSPDSATVKNRMKALSQWPKTCQTAIDQHQEMIRRIDRQKEVWKNRYALLKQVPDRNKMHEWFEQSRQSLSQIDRVLAVEQKRQNSLWRQTGLMDTPKARTQDRTLNGNGKFAGALRQLALYRTEYINTLEAGRWVEGRLSDELDSLLERRPIKYQAENHTILKSPEPFVLFTDFGDNALTFKVQFWINVARVIERRRVESQMRFHIDALFRKANIVIAYPQRDVHMVSTEPLKIQLLSNGKNADKRGKTDG